MLFTNSVVSAMAVASCTLTPLIFKVPDVAEISAAGMRISFCVPALTARPAAEIAVFSQFATSLVDKLAPFASSKAGNGEPSSFKAPAAITVMVLPLLFVKLGKAPPRNMASAVTTELPSSKVSITAPALAPMAQALSR